MEKTAAQQKQASDLARKLGIGEEDIYFLRTDKPAEPWLSPSALITVARKSPELRDIADEFVEFVPPLNQLIYRGVVVDAQGRRFTRTGVATIGEKPELDSHKLAAGRALSASLRAAGFDPLKAGNVVAEPLIPRVTPIDDDKARNKRLAEIHTLAEQKGLEIKREGQKPDNLAYRRWLYEHFGVWSTVRMSEGEHQQVINALKQLPDFDPSAIEEDDYQMEVAA
jgi:hypothetical protein